MNDKVVVTYNVTAMAQPAPGGKIDESVTTTPVVTDGTLDIPAVLLARGEEAIVTHITDCLQGSVAESEFVSGVKLVVDKAAGALEATNNLLPETARLYMARSKATEAFKASAEQLIDKFDPIDDDSFWTYIVLLQERLLYHDRPEHFVKRACENLIWEMVHGEQPGGGLVGWQRGCEFLHAYRGLVSTLHRRCGEMRGLDKGDDSYGDFCDSLPLAGRKIVEALLDEEQCLWSYDRVQAELTADVHGGKLTELICEGENYFAMFLEDKLLYHFAAVARDLTRAKCKQCGSTADADEINEDGICEDCQPFCDIEED